MKPIGIYGGTFDPVHIGHVGLASSAAILLDLDRVIWVPAGTPPHRGDTGATGTDRLAMVRMATAGHARFEVDDAEVLSDTPSYTVKTLERLRMKYGPTVSLVLLVGADAFAQMESWHSSADLLSLVNLGVSCRPGYSISDRVFSDAPRVGIDQLGDQSAGAISIFIPEELPVSATDIRNRCQAGEDIHDLVQMGVMQYIHQKHLYS